MAVETTLRDYIATQLMYLEDPEALSSEEPLLGNGSLDSLGITRLVAFIEEEWGVEVADHEMTPEHFQDIEHMAALVERLQRG